MSRRSFASNASVFVTPVRGDKATQGFLRMFLELAVLMFQQRRTPPGKRVLLLGDEVPAWGVEQINSLRGAMNILRDKKVVVWLYGQSYSQLACSLSSTRSTSTTSSASRVCLPSTTSRL